MILISLFYLIVVGYVFGIQRIPLSSTNCNVYYNIEGVNPSTHQIGVASVLPTSYFEIEFDINIHELCNNPSGGWGLDAICHILQIGNDDLTERYPALFIANRDQGSSFNFWNARLTTGLSSDGCCGEAITLESEKYASLTTIGQHHVYIAMTPTSFKVIIDDQMAKISFSSERKILSGPYGYPLYLPPAWGYKKTNATLTNICVRSSDIDLYAIEATTFVTTETCRLPSTKAIAVSHGDNIQTAYMSYDGGVEFTEIGYETDWPQPLSIELTDVTKSTILRYTVEDQGVVGGFIGYVLFPDVKVKYPITNPITDGNWRVISSSDDSIEPLVYTEDQETWVRSSSDDNIDPDSPWVWNENIGNTMTFEFNFGNLCCNGADGGIWNPDIEDCVIQNAQSTTGLSSTTELSVDDLKVEKESALNVGAIVGVVVAILVPCLLIACCWYMAKKKGKYKGVAMQMNVTEENKKEGVGLTGSKHTTTKGETETELLPVYADLEEGATTIR